MAILLLLPTPTVRINPTDPMAAEMLEHWAAKLTLHGGALEVATAVECQKAAELFRAWRKDNPTGRVK